MMQYNPYQAQKYKSNNQAETKNRNKNIHKLNIYIQQSKYRKGKLKFVCIFPLHSFILMRILNRFQKYFERVFVYQQQVDKAQYFVEFIRFSDSQKEAEIILNEQIYSRREYVHFKKDQYLQEADFTLLPTYIWIRKKDNTNLLQYFHEQSIQFAYFGNDYLIELTEANQFHVKTILKEISNIIENKGEVSKYLEVKLNERYKGVLQQLKFLQLQMKRYNVVQNRVGFSQTCYLFETKHIFQTLSLRARLNENNIDCQFIDEKYFKRNSKIQQKLKNNVKNELHLQEISQDLHKKDIFYWDRVFNNTHNDFYGRMQFVTNNWSLYQPFYEKDMEQFQDCLTQYCDSQTKYGEMVPLINQINEKCQKVNEYKGVRQNYNGKKKGDNYLFEAFSQATIKNELDRCEILKGDTLVSLGQQIAQYCEYKPLEKVERVKNLFDRFTKIHKKTNNQSLGLSWQEIQNMQSKEPQGMKCLGCEKYFEYQTNICMESIQQEHKPLLLGTVESLKENQDFFKKSMRELMRVGGIILFDCYADYFQIKTIGCELSEEKRREIDEKIRETFQSLKEQTQDMDFQKFIEISFVPIAKNMKVGKENEERQQKFHLRGYYVTRVKINIRFIKIAETLEERQKLFYNLKFFHPHQGNCLKPLQFPQQQIFPKKKKKQIKKSTFLYASLIVWQQQKKFHLQNLLKSYGFDDEFAVMQWKSTKKVGQYSQQQYYIEKVDEFLKYGFIIFHNFDYNKLKQKRQQMKKKGLSFRKIELFIHLKDQINDYNELQQAYCMRYKGNSFRIWKLFYKQDEHEVYIESQDHQQSVFLYTLFSVLNLKIKFQLPQGQESFQAKDINKKFKLLHPKGSQQQQGRRKNNLYIKLQSLK